MSPIYLVCQFRWAIISDFLQFSLFIKLKIFQNTTYTYISVCTPIIFFMEIITLDIKHWLLFQSISLYKVIVQVDDGKNDVVSTEIRIRVSDVNDNHPTFIGLPYRAEIPEVRAFYTYFIDKQ